MTLSTATRLLLGGVLLAALAACAKAPESGMEEGAEKPPARLATVEVSDVKRQRLARAAQLQTPLSLPPQATGAPAAETYYANGLDVGALELQGGGVDISPDLRVWQRWPETTRQIYGSEPTPLDPILQPVVIPTR